MKPVDFRNATFADLQARVTHLRAIVLEAWRKHGPGTTEQIAERSGISILTLRPRTTELCQLAFLTLADKQSGGHEGVYRVRTMEEIEAWLAHRQAEATDFQRQLPLLYHG